MGTKFDDLPLFLTPQQLAQITGFAKTKEGLLFGEKVES